MIHNKIRKAIKNVAKPITRVTERLLKPIVRPLRPIAARVAPIVNPVGLFLGPKAFGIRSEKSTKIFTNTQRVGRIVTGAAAAVVAAPVVAPALASAGGAILSGGGAMLSAAGARLKPAVKLFTGQVVPPGAVGGDLGSPIYDWNLSNDAAIKSDLTTLGKEQLMAQRAAARTTYDQPSLVGDITGGGMGVALAIGLGVVGLIWVMRR